MVDVKQLATPIKPHWCPGCGDFGLLMGVKQAISELNLEPEKVAIASGIGCSSHLPNYVQTFGIHSIHGRSLPVATGVKLANPDLTVLIYGGDGDGYGIGMGHFIHTIKRNIDITYIVADNQIYGLTKGQTSPTSEKGVKTVSTPHGSPEEPIHPLHLAIAAGATFVARGFAGDVIHFKEILKQAIQHKGFSLIDCFQPCVVWNKVNTYAWVKERAYKLGDDYDPTDKKAAIEKAMEDPTKKIALGVIYKEEGKPTYIDEVPYIKHPVVGHKITDKIDVKSLIDMYR